MSDRRHERHCASEPSPLDGWTGPCDCVYGRLRDARAALDRYLAAEWGGPEWDAAWDELCAALYDEVDR